MKRDMELIRTILLKVEADPKFNGSANPTDAASLGLTDHSNAEVIYHLIMLIEEAGFLAGNTKMARMGSPGAFQASDVVVFKLTWQGHEFLDSVRDPDIWRKTKERATVTGVGLALLWEIARAELKKKLGLP
jgi:hypothetical protein